MKFRKIPVEIEAIQWSGNWNLQEINNFVGKELKIEIKDHMSYSFDILIETKDGTMRASEGDWIIKEPFPTGDRDFYPCKPDIFEKTYEKVE